MANKLTDMSKIRKAIKFHCCGKSKLFISNYLSLSRNTVKKYIALFDALGLNLEDLEKKSDADLEDLFFPIYIGIYQPYPGKTPILFSQNGT